MTILTPHEEGVKPGGKVKNLYKERIPAAHKEKNLYRDQRDKQDPSRDLMVFQLFFYDD
jgi:hypothetical protein